MKKKVYLVAGGTGGHINAAIAIGEKLESEGLDIEYLTGTRELDYKLLSSYKTQHLDAKPLRTKNPLQLIRNILNNLKSFWKILKNFQETRPVFVVGAGGYVCGPTLLAAYLLGIKVYIIEQNAVMGLTNRLLSFFSSKIFVHFEKTLGLRPRDMHKVRVVGNPTRSTITPVPLKEPQEKLHVLVFGGSLGAKQINDTIFSLLKNLPFKEMVIHHQTGTETVEVSTEVEYVNSKYIDNMQREYEWCDVIISRAGASTISELSIIKKPVLIFPYPHATDNHQYHNAKIFQESSDFSVFVLDPKIALEEGVIQVKDFLVKAKNKELKYTQAPSQGNNTCEAIVREIFEDVGMA
ncbi:MAG: UDP-N-acetylglucosamine--N-acetylmuramyl-(pentapeptide) pyrophosphoryl-undecaprenol N-acetylglucosamine transferase [Candidatus Caldatribacteriota bacterium]